MSTDPQLQHVAQLISTGRINEAKDVITQILSNDGQNADAWYLAATILGDPQAQIRALERTLNISPSHEQARRALEQLKAQSGQSPARRPQTSSVLSFEDHIDMGMIALTHHDRVGAVSAFSKAIRLNPAATDAYVQRGMIYEANEEFEDAIEDYKQALQLDPQHPQAKVIRVFVENSEKPDWQVYSVGVNYCNHGDYSRAIDQFSKAIKLDPKSAVYYMGRAKAYREWGDLTSAINDLDKAIKLDSKSAEIFMARGIARDLKSDFDGAISDFSQAIKLVESASAYFERGKTESKKANYKAALNDFSQALKLDPELAEAYSFRGMVRLSLKDREGAYEDYLAAIAIEPTQMDATALLIKIEQVRLQENKLNKR